MSYKTRIPHINAELEAKLEAVAKAGAEQIAQSAKERAPVNTGKLRDAIHVDQDGGGFAVIAGNKDVFYGHIVEHGGNRTAPRPFMIPALEQHREEIIAAGAAAIRSAT
jgi:HK97 gp10 family phage protein